MSETQTVWMILWDRAKRERPFEIDEVVPAVAKAQNLSDDGARRLVNELLTELGRLPEGRQFFVREGNAVVPLPKFVRALNSQVAPLDAYPFEL